MRLLALDAALDQCSAALLQDDACLGWRQGGDSRAATATLPGLVQELLREHGRSFDAVAATVGPGSFTGLRGALALAHGLGLGAGVPVIGVTVPEALLAQLGSDLKLGATVWIALDGRRPGRVFLFRDDALSVERLDALPTPRGPILLAGNAAGTVADRLLASGMKAQVSEVIAVSAEAVGRVARHRLAGELPPCEAQPLYVETAEARPPAGQRPAPV